MPKATAHIQKERDLSPAADPPPEEPQSESPQTGKGWRWVLIIWLTGFALIFLVEIYIMILSLIRWFGREG